MKKRATIVVGVAKAMPIELKLEENEFFQYIARLGEAKGESRIVTKFLERRLGALPEATRNRIAAADVEALERWADRLDSAATLDDVFEG